MSFYSLSFIVSNDLERAFQGVRTLELLNAEKLLNVAEKKGHVYEAAFRMLRRITLSPQSPNGGALAKMLQQLKERVQDLSAIKNELVQEIKEAADQIEATAGEIDELENDVEQYRERHRNMSAKMHGNAALRNNLAPSLATLSQAINDKEMQISSQRKKIVALQATIPHRIATKFTVQMPKEKLTIPMHKVPYGGIYKRTAAQEDKTRIAENLTQLSIGDAACRHMAKRIISYQIVAGICRDYHREICVLRINERMKAHEVCVSPKAQNSNKEYENAHISLLPQVVLIHQSGESLVSGYNSEINPTVALSPFPGHCNSAPLRALLACADYAHWTINAIDEVSEFSDRTAAVTILETVVQGMPLAMGVAALKLKIEGTLSSLEERIVAIRSPEDEKNFGRSTAPRVQRSWGIKESVREGQLLQACAENGKVGKIALEVIAGMKSALKI
jgi:chaperonin cofactor prefoldin